MDYKKAMLEDLYAGISLMSEFHDPPDEVAEQFVAWMPKVSAALESAGLVNELEAWNNAGRSTRFCPDDGSIFVQVTALKGVLGGILSRLTGDAPLEELIPMESVQGTRVYIEKVASQANGCYQYGWYDACAVMVRRLIETLIIECFEQHSLSSKVKDDSGEYVGLEKLIDAFFEETSWQIPRNVRRHLPKLKELKRIGDAAAHGRHYVTKRMDLENLSEPLRFTLDSLVAIAGYDNKPNDSVQF